MSETARVSLSLHEGKLEIAGAEQFVTDQLKQFDEIIRSMLARPSSTPDAANQTERQERGDDAQPELPAELEHVFALADNRVQILKDIPGGTMAQKMVNATLLYLYGASVTSKAESIDFETLRDVCLSHGCLDSKNFSSTIKAEKQYFIVTGSSRRQAAALTKPGRNRAQALVGEISA